MGEALSRDLPDNPGVFKMVLDVMYLSVASVVYEAAPPNYSLEWPAYVWKGDLKSLVKLVLRFRTSWATTWGCSGTRSGHPRLPTCRRTWLCTSQAPSSRLTLQTLKPRTTPTLATGFRRCLRTSPQTPC